MTIRRRDFRAIWNLEPSSALAFSFIFVAFFLIRAAFIDADPPITLSGSLDRAQDFWLEPPAKAHEARNRALFGVWQTNSADHYQFWRQQSPMWVYPLAAAFSIFGVSYSTLHWFSIAIASVGFVTTLSLARTGCTRGAATATGLCLSTSYYAMLLDRSGLIEVMVASLVAVMIFCLLRGDKHPAWLVASQAAFGIAFFSKQGAIYAFPILVVANLTTFRKTLEAGRHKPWVTWLPVATAIVLATGATIYIVQPGYQRTLSWNYQHMMFAGSEDASSWYRQIEDVLRRIVSSSRYRWHWLIPFPVVGTVALVTFFYTAVRIVRHRLYTRWEALIAGWYLSAFAALLVIRQNEVRFTTIVIIPTFLMFGHGLTCTMRQIAVLGHRRIAATVGIFATVASTSIDISRYAQWIETRKYQLRDAGAQITNALGPQPAVIAGRFSAPLLLETPYYHYYVKWYFNTKPDTIRSLRITHALWRTHEEETKIHFSRMSDAYKNNRTLLNLPFRKDIIELVEFSAPLK